MSVFYTNGNGIDLKSTVLVGLFLFHFGFVWLVFLFCFGVGFFWRWKSPTTTGSIGIEDAKKYTSYFMFPAKVYLHTMPSTADLELQRSFFFGPSKFDCCFPHENSTGNQAPCGSSWRRWQTRTPKPCISGKLLQAHSYNSNIDIWKIFMQNFFFLIIVGSYSGDFFSHFFCSQPRTETATTKPQRLSWKYLSGKRWFLQTLLTRLQICKLSL